MDNKQRHYRIDPEFRDLIPPISQNKYDEMEKAILIEGCRESVITWNGYIIDGHIQYEICLKHDLEPPVFTMNFTSREEVIIWICSTQLSRRNVNDTVRKYLIGKRYETEKIISAHSANGCFLYFSEDNATELPSESSVMRTRERIGKEYGVGPATVYRYGEFAKSIDKIRRISPTAAKKILNESALVNINHLIAMTELPYNEVRKFCRRINELPDEVISYSKTKAMISRYISEESAMRLPDTMGAIKQMPQYDADAEIKSLSLTVPSWTRSIERVMNSPNTSKSSQSARMKLKEEIKALKSISDKLLYKLEEEPVDE